MTSHSLRRLFTVAALVAIVVAAIPATAQVNLLWYKEVAHDGRIYVFNDPNTFKSWEGSREMGKSLTKIGYGPAGETVVFENETALDLYNLKHDKDGEVRDYKAPAAPKADLPTSIKIGDGELKFGALVQAWYVTDDSEASTGSSQLGNDTGKNTFRLRRAEIKLGGTVVKGWGFEIMLDPVKAQNISAGNDGKIIQDLAVVYEGLHGHKFMLGQKKIFLTEEGVRSSSALDFAERSVVVRQISDRRETGFFWQADWSPMVTSYVSISNGTASNVLDDSNDTAFFAGRLDIKPIKGLNVGVSGATSGGEGASHLGRERFGLHARYAGGDVPLTAEFEYYAAKDESISGTTRTDLKRDGWYAEALWTIQKQFQIGGRYEEFNRNKDSATSNKIKIFTGGLHYLVKGTNANLKLNVESIKDDGRRINNVLDETYIQGVLAAQIAF